MSNLSTELMEMLLKMNPLMNSFVLISKRRSTAFSRTSSLHFLVTKGAAWKVTTPAAAGMVPIHAGWIPNTAREIAVLIEKLYGHHYSAATVSNITEAVQTPAETFLSRPLSERYVVIFMDAIYLNVRRGSVAKGPFPLDSNAKRRFQATKRFKNTEQGICSNVYTKLLTQSKKLKIFRSFNFSLHQNHTIFASKKLYRLVFKQKLLDYSSPS